jgi:HD-GYP domain-containing protein (c-di-GMP phosphodiesterase class II)
MDNKRDDNDKFLRLAESTDQFEGYAHPHALRIARLTDAVARHFNLGRSDRQSLRAASLAHDLGEAAMKRDYITRPGSISDEERLDMMRHPIIGEQEAARRGADRGAQLLVRWHHEWWNGSGYPDAIRREQIPLGARIIRVVDAYAALTDARPYHPARSAANARRFLSEGAGLEFDPRIVSAFLSLHSIPELDSFAISQETDDDGWETDAMIQKLVQELGD